MKIAIPTIDGMLCPHFGHCEQFAILDVDPETKSINAVQMLTPPAHQPGVLPRWLSEMGCNLIIAGGMGQRAIGMFLDNGVEVVVGAGEGKAEDIARDYLNGALQSGDNVCDH